MAEPVTLTVLTFNCLFRPNTRPRLAALAAELERSGPDIVCLQEIVWRRNVNWLRSLTPSYPFAAYRPSGWLGVMGGLLTLSRFPIERYTFSVYRRRGRLNTIAAADWLLRKGCLSTWLRVHEASIAVLNTHLLANYDEDWSPTNDYARQLRSELDQLTGLLRAVDPTVTAVVAGDLNVPSDTELFAGFVRGADLADGFNSADRPVTISPHADGACPYAIDVVLVRPPKGAEARVDSKIRFEHEVVLRDGRRSRLSDHNAVEARIEIGRH